MPHRLWTELLDAWGEVGWADNVIAAMVGGEVEVAEKKAEEEARVPALMDLLAEALGPRGGGERFGRDRGARAGQRGG